MDKPSQKPYRGSYDDAIQLALNHLLPAHTSKWLSDYGIPMPMSNYDEHDDNIVSQIVTNLRSMLNTQQTEITDAIMAAINSPITHTPKVFYLDGPGGCGKTFTYNYPSAYSTVCTRP